MYVPSRLNTVRAVQMFFIERIFIFFMLLFSKKMGIILGAIKSYCHSKFSKPVVKILSIYRKKIFWKQTFPSNMLQITFQNFSPKFQIFSTKINVMVKVVKQFTAVCEKATQMNFIGKKLCRSLFSITFDTYRLKKDSCTAQIFSCEFYQIFQNVVETNLSDCFCLISIFVRYVDLSHKKCFLQPWLF